MIIVLGSSLLHYETNQTKSMSIIKNGGHICGDIINMMRNNWVEQPVPGCACLDPAQPEAMVWPSNFYLLVNLERTWRNTNL